jgi:hypothetical protein
MPVGAVLNREMNLCRTTLNMTRQPVNAVSKNSGNWYVRNMQHKKAGHLRFVQTNAISEVIGQQWCYLMSCPVHKAVRITGWVPGDGILCRFLDYNFNEDGSQNYTEPYMYTNVKTAR